jgi:hypothetical protein
MKPPAGLRASHASSALLAISQRIGCKLHAIQLRRIEVTQTSVPNPNLQTLQKNDRTTPTAVRMPKQLIFNTLASLPGRGLDRPSIRFMPTINNPKSIGTAAAGRILGTGAAWISLITLAALFSALPLHAFPPAPYHTIFGDVRDDQGVLIPVAGAAVVMSQGGVTRMREELAAVSGANFNYEIRMRMDMGRSSTATYSSLVVSTASAYTLAVDIGGVLYHPLEITGTLPTVGAPAARVRLNLTLGVDSDGDGLPDAWEESQLYQAGYLPGENGWDLSLLDRAGDLDKDGLSNGTEYIAGTYAGDATSTISMVIKEKKGENVRLETYAIYGKSYTIESSTDLKRWTAASFSTADPAGEAPEEFKSSLVSPTTGVTSLYAKGAATTTYYRLHIR